jgi:hypothetical protein
MQISSKCSARVLMSGINSDNYYMEQQQVTPEVYYFLFILD